MPDSCYTSRYRITYTPDGEPPIILLDAGDWCDGALALTCDLTTQEEQGILSAWGAHYSRGNARAPLNFTHYAATATREAAQITGIERLFYLTGHPEGELLLEMAWGGPTPQVSQRLRATLTSVTWQDESGELSPCDLWLAMSYSFMISPITDE